MTSSSSVNARPSRMPVILAFALVIVAALHASWSTLDRYFLGDDFGYVARFSGMSLREWPSLFTHEWSGGVWGYTLPELRPFAALTFLVDAHLWGANPLGFHLTNFLLDAACACFVALIVWRLHGASLWLGTAAGIFFAWHPAHAEPVAWITGRVDLISTLAYLAGFFSGAQFLREGKTRWLLLAVAAYFVGCFSKEFCLTLPIALLLWCCVYRPVIATASLKRFGMLFGSFVAVAAVFLICRHLAFGNTGAVPGTRLFSAEYAERQFDYLRWYFPPLYHFGRDYRPLFVSIAPGLIGGLLPISIAVLALWRWQGPTTAAWRAATFYGLCWYLVATLPMAAATYFAPRHLYLATAGFAIGVGLLLVPLASRRWLAVVVVVFIAQFSLSRFDHAVAPWRHAAKVSERVSSEVKRAVSQLTSGEILLLDVPDVYEGVWMWSWSVPFSTHPPFLSNPPQTVLSAPAVFYQPSAWATSPALTRTVNATGAVLLRVNDKGEVISRAISRAQLERPVQRLAHSAAADANAAWHEFIASFPTP